MRIILDTVKKEICIVEPILIDKLISELDDLFEDWREYKIVPNYEEIDIDCCDSKIKTTFI